MDAIIFVCNNSLNSLYCMNTLEYGSTLKYFYSSCDKEYGDAKFFKPSIIMLFIVFFLRGQIKGFNCSITTILFEVGSIELWLGSYRTLE